MRSPMRNMFRALPIVLTLTAAIGTSAAAETKRDRCVVDRSSPGAPPLNRFVFRELDDLRPGGAITVRGIYFTGANKPAPFHGSAIMASDGSVRLGLFVHSSAEQQNDFTISGVTDADFAGTVKFDNDGDFVANGTLNLELVNCSTITVP
jgi:hypothetical protein